MKKKIMQVAGLVTGILFCLGLAFCIARPDYVREAVSILLENELDIPGESSKGDESVQDNESDSSWVISESNSTAGEEEQSTATGNLN